MSTYPTNEFRKGLKLEIEKVPYQIVEFQHVSPGKGSAFTRTKLRNLLTNKVIEKTFKSGEKIDGANVDIREMQFLYKDSAGYNFMNMQSYDQVVLQDEQVADSSGFLQENLTVSVMYYNDRPISLELPTFVELKVVSTEPAIRGDTVTGGSKPAKLETGASVQVPMHIKEGDVLKVDTRDSTYVEKVNR